MSEASKSFESAMQRLEVIVQSMEKGELPLEGAMELFEEGTKLVQQCNGLLNEAELKVTKLMKGEDGSPVETEFDYEP